MGLNKGLENLNALRQKLIAVTDRLADFEADLLNVALFGMTAKEWRAANPRRGGNIRDYASVEQLVVLANIESMNSELLRRGVASGDRLRILNEMAIRQLETFASVPEIKKLKG